jgi:23S rRNA (guanine745-N1)-methyltransferase
MPRPVAPLICPNCGGPLAGDGERRGDFAALRCPAGHSFDVAREGYVNLSGGRSPKHPGDTREQVEARRAFFEAGYYAPLIDALAEIAAGRVAPSGVVLDAGSGEGTYTAALASAVDGAVVIGLDVSKEAVRLAARTYSDPRFVVADLTGPIPLASGSVGLLTNIFAPRHPAEYARLLAPAGWLLVVIPTPDHLAGLRTRFDLLGIESDKQESVIAQMEAVGLRLAEVVPVAFPLSLDGPALMNLIAMTPSYHHLTAEQIAAARTVESVEAAVSVRVLVLRRGG